MILDRLTPVTKFVIYNPRWHDRMVLLAKYRVGTHNVITFPKANTMQGEFYISGNNARQFSTMPLKTKAGPTMEVYEIPIDALEPFERK